MARFRARVLIALFGMFGLLLPGLAAAQVSAGANGGDIAAAIRGDRWAEAAVRAASDPVAAKLVTYYRLLAPGQGHVSEIAAFMVANPDWPWPITMERRRQEALAREMSASVLAVECQRAALTLASALLRCAEAGLPSSTEYARRAWAMGEVMGQAQEAQFLKRWANALHPGDHEARLDATLANGAAAVQRLLPLLPAETQALAQTRLAIRQGRGDISTLLRAVPEQRRDDPGLFLDEARRLRKAGEEQEALALWRERGAKAQAGLDGPALEPFWSERHLFSRQRLRAGDAAGAYLLAAGHGELPPPTRVDAQFLAGFIALRFLQDPSMAAPHFRELAATSGAAITQGRAQYWLGRTAAAAGSDPKPAYARAAAWPTTFYGQLAVQALGEDEAALAKRIRDLRDPKPSANPAESELGRAASMLVAWGEKRRAFAFLLRMDEQATTPEARAALAQLAHALDMPEAAVAIARRMGRDGWMLPEAGWPTTVSPPGKTVPVAVSLGLIRQESSFDIQALSPAGARGLMQLMPATARQVAKSLGERTSSSALLADPAHNMRLGTAYLHGLMERFDALPLALAAYNAGPHRVSTWLQANGDPRASADPDELIDWIELIPFNETRNYVQRVLENVAIYRSRDPANRTAPLAGWATK